MIALDDVPTLLHILIVRQFCTYVMLDWTITTTMLVELLGVDMSDVMAEMKHWLGEHMKLSCSMRCMMSVLSTRYGIIL